MDSPRALVVINDPTDPPERVGDWLAGAGVTPVPVRAYAGEALPTDLSGHAAMVVMGGAMAATDDVPWFSGLFALLREAVATTVPTLGICLGGQLVAAALGGTVERGAHGPELGPALVAKRDVAAKDPLFGPVPFTPDVIQWHRDAITALPAGAELLASSPTYPNQAFRVGRAYGLQFHIETTPAMVAGWAKDSARDLAEAGLDGDRLVARAKTTHEAMRDVWEPFVHRFAGLVGDDRG